MEEARKNLRLIPAPLFREHRNEPITIVMLSHGRLDRTISAIVALTNHVVIPFILLLIDNNSGDGIPEKLRAYCSAYDFIKLVLLKENLGCVGGRAYALDQVETELVMFLDNDIEVFPGTVEHLVCALQSNQAVVAASSNVILPDGIVHVCGGHYEAESDIFSYELLGAGKLFSDPGLGVSGLCKWIPHGATIFRKNVFTQTAYDLSMKNYYEDLEWCYRLNQAGEGCFYRSVESLALHHHESKVPDPSAPAYERRREAIKYIESIGHFYRLHGKIIQNLFDFMPELGDPGKPVTLQAGKLVLDLFAAYGAPWVLERWERGELGPLFGAAGKEQVEALSAELTERTAWARRAADDVAHRDALIRGLQASRDAEIAHRDADVAHRDALIRGLQANRDAEIAHRDALIRDLQGRLERLERSRAVRLARAARRILSPSERSRLSEIAGLRRGASGLSERAPAAGLTATPNPVPAGADETTIAWSTGDESVGQVWVAEEGRPEVLFAEGDSGSLAAPWVAAGSAYEFRLYAGTARTTLLDTVTVTRLAPARPTATGGGSKPGALILLYHRVAEVDPDPWSLCVTPRHFAEHAEVLRQHAHPIHLPQLLEVLQAGSLPRRSVVVTFDDGYTDNLYSAKPVLERHEIPWTIFLTSGYIGQEREFWWDELERLLLQPGTLPRALDLCVNGDTHHWELGEASYYDEAARRRHRDWRTSEDAPSSRHFLYRALWQLLHPMRESERRSMLDELRGWAGAEPSCRPSHRPLSVEETVALADGELVEIGAHTVTHPALGPLPPASQREEIVRSKARLEELLGRPVMSFAYPHGDYTAETVSIVREAGFARACSVTFAGLVHPSTDPFRLPRVQIQDWDGEELARRLSAWFDGRVTVGGAA